MVPLLRKRQRDRGLDIDVLEAGMSVLTLHGYAQTIIGKLGPRTARRREVRKSVDQLQGGLSLSLCISPMLYGWGVSGGFKAAI